MKRQSWMVDPPSNSNTAASAKYHVASQRGSTTAVLSTIFPSKNDDKDHGEVGKKKPKELNPYFGDGGDGLPPVVEEEEVETVTETGIKEDGKNGELGEESLNKLQAKRTKAQLSGDDALINAIDAKIDALKPKITLLPHEQLQPLTNNSSIQDMLKHEKASKHKTNIHNYTSNSNSVVKQVINMERIKQKCWFCRVNDDDFLIMARGHYCYLALPLYGRVHPWHAMIIPYEHTSSTITSDHMDDLREEIRNFKKCLLRMWASKGLSGLFAEVCTNNNNQVSINHAYIDAMPFNNNAFNAELTWHKALTEAESEFTLQHKSVIKFSKIKPLHNTIPINRAYMAVWLGVDEGMVHLIEGNNESINGIKGDFGRVVMRGHRLWNNSNSDEGSTQCTKVDAEQFRKLYKEFDWTPLLNQ